MCTADLDKVLEKIELGTCARKKMWTSHIADPTLYFSEIGYNQCEIYLRDLYNHKQMSMFNRMIFTISLDHMFRMSQFCRALLNFHSPGL